MTVETQALSDRHKDAVRSWVPRVRRVLEEDLIAQLERLGVRPDGKYVPVETMRISADASAVRTRVEALLRHDALAEGSPGRGYENVLWELTYTLLNRLVGLKSMEARGLLYPSPPDNQHGMPEQTEVITPIPGQVRSRYLRDFRAAGGTRYRYEDAAEEALLRDGLTAAFRHITSEIRLLFDPDHEYACVWPTHACLVRVIGMINNDLPEDAYRAHDFLGWVYQFFNRDEKKQVRAENKGIPRSSYELSVINQFYTPSWVVKVLVDNTLGRLWLQMHPDSALASKGPPPLPDARTSDDPVADYLGPQTGEKLHYQRLTEEGQVETYKRACDIALLDPACGTMHFGQYAFGLFYRMYLDEIAHAGAPGWPAEPSVRDPKDIPAAIITNNLFGIDIDPRAIQIASLSLLLTAKEAALRHGYPPQDVHISRTNLVVANAVNLGEERLRTLINRLGPRLGSIELQERLFKTVWENLQYVGELGSLIQVREGVTRVLQNWAEQQAKKQGITQPLWVQPEQQLELGTIRSDLVRQQARQMELQRRLLEEDATQLRHELLAGVEAAAAEDGADPDQRLFAEDTARGLKLLEVLSRHYDVVVMNPPYGSFVPQVRDFIRAAYPLTYSDIYATFIDRGTQLLTDHGYLGALVYSTFKTNSTLERFRTSILLKRNPLVMMLDLGPGILDDATNETAAIVLASENEGCIPIEPTIKTSSQEKFSPCPEQVAVFFNLTKLNIGSLSIDGREEKFVLALEPRPSEIRYLVALSGFETIEGSPLAYNRINFVATLFRQLQPLRDFAEVYQGLITRDDPRYIRFFWEVQPNLWARPWKHFHKGGTFSRFHYEPDLVIDWSQEAQRDFHRLRDVSIYLRAGLTWPRAAGVFNVRIMREGCVFSDKGPAILLTNQGHTLALCAILNSSLGLLFAKTLTSRETMGGRWEIGIVKRVPIPDIALSQSPDLATCAQAIHDAKARWDRGNEVSTAFSNPWILRDDIVAPSVELSGCINRLVEHETAEDARIQRIYAELNDKVYRLYGISESLRVVIEETLGENPREIIWPQMGGKTVEQKRMEHVWRLLSYVVKRVVETDADGIVPFMAISGETALLERVHQELAALFPGRDVNQVEVEITNELKRKVKGYKRTNSIREWLEDVFFDYHVALYKHRPSIWHISSKPDRGDAAFAALIHYHKFDKDRMAKLRSSYLREALNVFRREVGLATQAGRTNDRLEWQTRVEEAEALDQRLQWLQEGQHEGAEGGDRDFRILTPWKSAEERPQGWDPDFDDGVKVNIEPLQRAGVLRRNDLVR